MSLKYSLVKSSLAKSEGEMFARVVDVRSYSQKEFIQEMADSGTTLTHVDIVAAMDLLKETLIRLIQRGDAVHLDFLRMNYSINGVFADEFAPFDKSEHSVRVNVNPAQAIIDATEHIKVERVEASDTAPHISRVHDFKTDSLNEVISAGNTIEVFGSHLKVSGEDKSVGVYLNEVGTSNTIKVTQIRENKPSRLLVVLPDALPKGKLMQLSVTTQHGAGKDVVTPKTGIFHTELKVV